MPAFCGAFVERSNIVLLHRSEDGTLLKRVRPARWSFFLAAPLAPEVDRAVRRSAKAVSEEGRYIRVDWRDGQARRAARKWLEGYWKDGLREGCDPPVEVFEGDVSPVRRYFSDTGDEVDVSMARACYLDIETDNRVPFSRKEEARLLCWSVMSHATGEAAAEYLRADTDRDERELIEQMFEALAPYDVVLAWNGDRFDFEVLDARAELRRFDLDAWHR